MNKHTSGPWYADPGRRVTGFAITHDGEPNPLAICLRKPANSYSKGISDAKALANARLIAASPCMYALLAKRADHGDEEAADLIRRISNG